MVDSYLTAFAVSLVVAFAAVPIARIAALRLKILDAPQAHKSHLLPVPRLGGAAMVIAFAVAATAAFVIGDVEVSSHVAAIFAGGLLIVAIGLWDDVRGLPTGVKLALEVVIAAGLYWAGLQTRLFDDFAVVDLVLTLGWIVGITNAVNLMDNMDGLTAGISAIAALYLFALATDSGQSAVAILSATLAGSALGFLWHNRPPARIFMGDSGSLFLGFMLAALGLELRFDNIEEVTFFVPVAVLAVPLIDTLMAATSRLRRGVSIFQPGRDHISHRLVAVGVPQTAAVALLCLAGVASGWLGVVIAYAEQDTAYMLTGWILAVGAFLAWLLMRVGVDD